MPSNCVDNMGSDQARTNSCLHNMLQKSKQNLILTTRRGVKEKIAQVIQLCQNDENKNIAEISKQF